MKTIGKASGILKKEGKMTLKDYYESLPCSVHPKTEFINKVCSLTGVSDITVRNWLGGKRRPSNQKHIVILSEVTGIPQEQLWD